MKLNIIELRDMVARAVRQTLREAKKAKLPAERSEESIASQRDRQVRALPGYAHSTPLDMSKPLGKRSRTRRQGASNIGNWTSESAAHASKGMPHGRRQESLLSAINDVLVRHGLHHGDSMAAAREIMSVIRQNPGHGMVDPASHGMDDPSELGVSSEAAIRKLVGMVVDEEVRVTRAR
jgi:hypothetical protein